jgi:glutaredoxin-related protein
MRMSHWWSIILLLVGASLVGCEVKLKAGYFDKDRANVLARIEEFRRFNDTQNYAEIYELGAPALKSAFTREQFIAAAQASSVQSGKYKSSTLMATSCFPNEVRLVYHTEFEKGNVTESMIWSVLNDKALLVLYRVSPGYDEVKKESQVGCPS